MTHGGYTNSFYDSWFVTYTPPENKSVEVGPGNRTAASDGCLDDVESDQPVTLLALEIEPKRQEGYWTFRPSLVSDVDRYISRNM